jgi:hypothetical protein
MTFASGGPLLRCPVVNSTPACTRARRTSEDTVDELPNALKGFAICSRWQGVSETPELLPLLLLLFLNPCCIFSLRLEWLK